MMLSPEASIDDGQLDVVTASGLNRINVVRELGRRLGASHASFAMTDAELLDDGLRRAGMPPLSEVAKVGWIDRALPFERAHFLEGFPHADGKFHFKPDWKKVGPGYARMPAIADWSADYEKSDAEHPYKLVCPPARNFLNSTFSETPTSIARSSPPLDQIWCARAGTILRGGLPPANLGRKWTRRSPHPAVDAEEHPCERT